MSLRPSHSRAMLLTRRDPDAFFCTYCECRFQHNPDAAGTPVNCPSCQAGLAALPHNPAVLRAVWQSLARPRAQQRRFPRSSVPDYWRESVWHQALKPALNTGRFAGCFSFIGAYRNGADTLFDRYISCVICGLTLFAVGFVVAYLVAIAVYAAGRHAAASGGRSRSLPSACF